MHLAMCSRLHQLRTSALGLAVFVWVMTGESLALGSPWGLGFSPEPGPRSWQHSWELTQGCSGMTAPGGLNLWDKMLLAPVTKLEVRAPAGLARCVTLLGSQRLSAFPLPSPAQHLPTGMPPAVYLRGSVLYQSSSLPHKPGRRAEPWPC